MMMKFFRLVATVAVFSTISAVLTAQAQNLLFNGDFELDTPVFFFYDNNTGNTGTATDVPGWEAFANVDSSSWVQVAEQSGTGNWILDLSGSDFTAPGFVGLAGIKTAVGNRPAVASGAPYQATVTYDNYFTSAGISYYIDWFDGGGALLSSSGGPLGDPNGPLAFAPTTQSFDVAANAPVGAASAGVRLESANGGFAGASADNFTFGAIPEPGTIALAMLGAWSMIATIRRRQNGDCRRRTDV
jgi:hypothetical protein